MGTLGEIIGRLIETDVPVMANTQKLQIRIPCLGNHRIVLVARSFYIGVRTVGHMCVGDINIDQVISINNYTIEDDSLAEIAKEYIESYKAENMNNAFWVTMGLLLLFLNIGTFIKIK